MNGEERAAIRGAGAEIGWAMARHFRTPLITGAMKMAAKNHPLVANCIAHSGRGSNYTSRDYAELLDELGLSQSLGRTGIYTTNSPRDHRILTSQHPSQR